jgi:hypothetical protein
MRRFGKLPSAAALIFLAGAIPGAAQTPGNQQSFGVVGEIGLAGAALNTSVAGTAGCPISLRAQHLADGNIVRARDGHAKGLGQWLRLVVEDRQPSPAFKSAQDLSSRRIAQAVVTVHGFSNQARMSGATAGKEGSKGGADAASTMIVTFTEVSDQSSAAEVWVPGMTAVAAIDLNTVVYAGGGSSSFMSQQGCRITPDPLMLIAGK